VSADGLRRLAARAALLLRPTLVRRVVGALLLAFFLVWMVLLAEGFVEFKRGMADDSGMLQLARSLHAELRDIPPDQAERARQVIAGADALINRLRADSGVLKGRVLIQLFDMHGQRQHPPASAPDPMLAGDPQRLVETALGSTRHWVVRQDAAPWSLRLAEPLITDVTVLGWFGRGLLVPLLIAFPIVLLTLWVAVRRGLRPLRQLADHVAARGSHDLSALGIEPRHAELKPLAAALDDLLAQLRQRVQREQAFVQDAAHELRTPMAVIATQAHLLSHAADGEQRAQAVQALEQAIERSSHLSGQLLALAALDDAQGGERTPVDVPQLVRQLLAQATPAALARGIELSLDAPDRLTVQLDAAALHSVLQNLLDNALHYVHDGARVAITLLVRPRALEITVADDGPGIAPDERERLFERFQRGRHRREVPGSGLGLAIVRQAVLRLRGTVEVRDGLGGRGVAFVIELPAD
jgi:two-component system sensor histidine kinase QseC